jgi:hypothetical protein
LLALAPRGRLASSLLTTAILLDLTRAILEARFTSLLGGIPAAVRPTILRRRPAIAASGAARNCACTLMHGARSHVWRRSAAWFLLSKSARRSGYQGDSGSRHEQSLRVHSTISLGFGARPHVDQREPMDEVPALTFRLSPHSRFHRRGTA